MKSISLPKGYTEIEAMNLLQEYGIISDNCVDWKDVGNQKEAVKWLKEQKPKKGERPK